MAKEQIPFSDFLELAGPEHEAFINEIHGYMLANDTECKIKEAKSGYVVSYIYKPTKHTVANYVFRKKGPMLRIYADNVAAYEEVLADWPQDMKEALRKAGPCKRMLDPAACNPRCQMVFDYMLEGQRQQKCRNGGFFFFLEDKTKPYLKQLVELEMGKRSL